MKNGFLRLFHPLRPRFIPFLRNYVVRGGREPGTSRRNSDYLRVTRHQIALHVNKKPCETVRAGAKTAAETAQITRKHHFRRKIELCLKMKKRLKFWRIFSKKRKIRTCRPRTLEGLSARGGCGNIESCGSRAFAKRKKKGVYRDELLFRFN